jgi:ubiquinone/menaquinone biosynthesis C-methylase UbiE
MINNKLKKKFCRTNTECGNCVCYQKLFRKDIAKGFQDFRNRGWEWRGFKLFSEKYEVHCVDYSEHCLAKLSEQVANKILLNLEVGKIPYSDGFFDAILVFEVLEHIKNIDHIMKEIERVLKPNGYVFASTPNINWFPFRIKFLFGMCPEDFHTTDHVHFWNLRWFRKLFTNYGFEIIKQGTSFGLPNVLYPFVKRYRKEFLEVYDKYIFIASDKASTILGYNQFIVAKKVNHEDIGNTVRT